MWAWDVTDTVEVSMSGNNLVIRFEDHITGKTVYSYLGSSDVTKTVSSIFNFLEKQNLANTDISLVPEVSLTRLDFTNYFIEIDINVCDYIYELQELASLSGNKYTQKRGRVNSFRTNFPDSIVAELDLKNSKVIDDINRLNDIWISKKQKNDPSLRKELEAVARFISSGIENALGVGVFVNEKMVGYAMYSFHRDDYAVNLFIKGDSSCKGIYEFLIQQSAVILTDKGYKFMNYQEDMGIEGLRRAKLAYRPTGYLRKYFIKRL